MGKFGEDLRSERISRNIALEDITAVTKISQRHLLALEQEHFRLLPGGILSKGIVRGYASALGLDQNTWTERFLRACSASGERSVENEDSWTEFASNVGKARLLKREAAEMRLRWTGAAILAVIVFVGAFVTVRLYGCRAGWWSTVIPGSTTLAHAASEWLHSAFARIGTYLGI